MEIILLLCLIVALIVIAALALMRKPGGVTQPDLSTEKLSKIEGVLPAIYQTQTEIRALVERVSRVESHQSYTNQSLATVGSNLAQTGTIAKSLAETSEVIRTELSRTQNDLTELRANNSARQDIELKTAESIRRLEAVIAGTHSKGAAGENILDAMFSMLPVEWQVRNFRVNDQPCEFGLRLPNNLVLPIDSKWAATNLLEQFIACESLSDKQRLKGQIENVVLTKAKEVRKYIDPNITVRFGVAAVPDAVYELCSGLLCETFRYNVAIIPYSMFVPYLLLIFHTTLKTSQNIDSEVLEEKLQHALDIIGGLREEVEGRYARALTMLSNARTDMGASLGKLNSEIVALTTSRQLDEKPTLGVLDA